MSAALDVNGLIGLPWQRGARGPDAYDCWGLVIELARRSGRTVPADWASADMTRAEQRALMQAQAPRRTLQLPGPAEGAIAYSRCLSHCGLVLHGRVLHAARGAGVVAWSISMWQRTFPDATWHAWHG